MKAFVTGATGFLGSALVDSLVRDGHACRGLIAPGASAESAPISASETTRAVELVEGDVQDAARLRTAMDGCDVLFHLAGIVGSTPASRAEYFDVNVTGTQRVMETAMAAGVERVVHCSSTGIYGLPAHVPAGEDCPPAPCNAYQASKLEGERIVRRLVERRGLPAVVVRPTACYGPASGALDRLAAGIASGRFVMIGSGRNRHQITYVDDIVAGLRLCGERANIEGQCFNIGSDEVTTLAEFLAVVADAVGADLPKRRLPAAPFVVTAWLYRTTLGRAALRPGVVDGWDFFTAERVFDVSRAKGMLGFEPCVRIEDGIPRTLAAVHGRQRAVSSSALRNPGRMDDGREKKS